MEGNLDEKGGLGSVDLGPCLSSQGAQDFEYNTKALGSYGRFKQGCECPDWLCPLEITGVCGRGLARLKSVRTRWAAAGEAGSEWAFCQRMKMSAEPRAAADKALPIW